MSYPEVTDAEYSSSLPKLKLGCLLPQYKILFFPFTHTRTHAHTPLQEKCVWGTHESYFIVSVSQRPGCAGRSWGDTGEGSGTSAGRGCPRWGQEAGQTASPTFRCLPCTCHPQNLQRCTPAHRSPFPPPSAASALLLTVTPARPPAPNRYDLCFDMDIEPLPPYSQTSQTCRSP